jgi:hypothetical protein
LSFYKIFQAKVVIAQSKWRASQTISSGWIHWPDFFKGHALCIKRNNHHLTSFLSSFSLFLLLYLYYLSFFPSSFLSTLKKKNTTIIPSLFD